MEEEEEDGAPAGVRKRKGGMLEATEHSLKTKSRRIDDDTLTTITTKDSRTSCPLLLGANSNTGREPMDRQTMGAINGLDLLEQRENEGGMAACDWTEQTTELHK